MSLPGATAGQRPSPRRRRLRHVGLLLAAALALTGLVAVTAGLVPVAASSGHWPVTRWFLHAVMRRSVATQSLGVAGPPPDLSAPGLARQGAGHYASSCAPCHGAPGQPRSPVVQAMLPAPPRLDRLRLTRWRDRELFWIVRHGVRYSAMPGWPAAGRDDEVWAMVAFLRRLAALDPTGYRELAYGDAPAPAASFGAPASGAGFDAVLADCARCHGVDGQGRGPGPVPWLAGLSADYLADSLRLFASGRRPSGIMTPVAAALDPVTIDRLAAHYAGLPPPRRASAGATAPPDLPAAGRALVEHGRPAAGIPACGHCHGPDAVADNPRFPDLDGQYAAYLARQLRLWTARRRGGDYATLMHSAAHRLDETRILAVSAYYAGLAPASADGGDRGDGAAVGPGGSDGRSR